MGECPECGSSTVVEKHLIEFSGGKTMRVERCDGLIEVYPNKPLDACTWERPLDDYYEINSITNVSGVGILKP